MVNYKPVDLSKNKSDAIVIHCCDPRFQEAYRQAAEQVSEFYDLLVVPGASKAVVDNPSVIENIKMLHSLHKFSEVQIMDHVECGAFGKIADEVDDHSKYIHMAKSKLEKVLPGIKVNARLLGATRELELKA